MKNSCSLLITGSIDCLRNQAIASFVKSESVLESWVDCVARGRGEYEDAIPDNFAGEKIVCVLDNGTLGSTQMGVHFGELVSAYPTCQFWYVLLLDNLSLERARSELDFLRDFTLVDLDELSSLVDQT